MNESFKLIYIEQYKSEILTGLTNPGLLGPLDFADKPSRYQPSSLNSCLSIVIRGLKSLKIQAGRLIRRNIKDAIYIFHSIIAKTISFVSILRHMNTNNSV